MTTHGTRDGLDEGVGGPSDTMVTIAEMVVGRRVSSADNGS